MAGIVRTVRQGFVPCDMADDAIAADVRELRRTPSPGPDQGRILHNLAISLYSRYRCTPDRRDIDAAILHARAVLRLMPLRHVDRTVVEGNLALFLAGRRADGDLAEACLIADRALAATAPGDPGYAGNLAQAAQVKFELFKDGNDPAHLNAAIEMFAELVAEHPWPATEAISFHLNYAVARLTRYGLDWSRSADLESALGVLTNLEDADLTGSPPGTANVVRAHLIQALSARYQLSGDEADQARIAALREELDASGDLALAGQNKMLVYDNAATATLAAYLRTGDLSLLDRAIGEQQRALAAAPPGDPNRPGLLSNLALCQVLRHREQHGYGGARSQDLADGIRLAQEAVAAGTGGFYDAAAAGILGTLLLEEATAGLLQEPATAERGPDSAQIDLAVQLLTRARDGMSPDDPQRAAAQAKLSQGLGLRSLLRGDVAGLRRAVDGLDAATAAVPAGSPYRAGALGALGGLLMALAAATGTDNDVDRAVSAARLAVEMASSRHPASAFDTALQWGDALWRLGRMELSGQGYAAALRILHDLTRAQLTMANKNAGLTRARDVTERAVVAFAYAGRPAEAALAAEAGRAIALSEALGIEQARILDVAARTHPGLVQAYQQAASDLARLQRDPPGGAPLPGAAEVDTQAGLRAAHRALDVAIGQLERALGVELLRAPTLQSLRDAVAVAAVPVVYLVASEIGGCAVIAAPDEPVRVVLLPELTANRVNEVTQLWLRAAQAEGDDGCAERGVCLMWADAMAAVTEALRGYPRAILVPAGALGILPLHAAGWQDSVGQWHYVTDTVSLGYAPNARVLAVCTQRASQRPDRPALLVADPRADGDAVPLPSAVEECEEARRHFAPSDVLACLYGEDATLPRVLSYLPRAAVMHFACHADVSRDEVLDSAVILAGRGRLSLRDLLQAELPMARLAVLSACSSALAGADLQNEVVSLPSALAQAGVAGVVGSLWAVDDIATAVLLARFYDLWLTEQLPGPAALAGAQTWMRRATNGEIAARYPRIELGAPADPRHRESWQGQRDFAAPLWWAPFIFVGA
jgi:hypothetical protein